MFDLLRLYELECAIKSGVPSERILVMPPYDFFLIERRIKQFQNDNNTVISMSERASFAVFQLLNGLQKEVGLESSLSCRAIPSSVEGQIPSFSIASHHLHSAFPLLPSTRAFSELQLVSIPILSTNHNSEMIWLPRFDIAFSFDSYPELHKSQVCLVHTFCNMWHDLPLSSS